MYSHGTSVAILTPCEIHSFVRPEADILMLYSYASAPLGKYQKLHAVACVKDTNQNKSQ